MPSTVLSASYIYICPFNLPSTSDAGPRLGLIFLMRKLRQRSKHGPRSHSQREKRDFEICLNHDTLGPPMIDADIPILQVRGQRLGEGVA